MAVLTPIPASPLETPAAAPSASGPVCSIQRSGSLWQLGVEAQELTTAIGQLAQQLEADDPKQRQSALVEQEAALLAEEGNKAALAAKADATCWVIEHLRGQAAYRQQQAKRLTSLATGDNSRADALEEFLIFVLSQLQPKSTRFSFPNHELTSRKSSAVVIDNEEALDPQWLTVTTTSKPDKNASKRPSRPVVRSPGPSCSPVAPGASPEGGESPHSTWACCRSGPTSLRPAAPRHAPAPQRGNASAEPDAEQGLEPLDPATIQQILATVRGLPRPALEGFTKAFRKRFQIPADVPSIADRICQRRHHDWIETFLVSHREVRSTDQHREVRSTDQHREVRSAERHQAAA